MLKVFFNTNIYLIFVKYKEVISKKGFFQKIYILKILFIKISNNLAHVVNYIENMVYAFLPIRTHTVYQRNENICLITETCFLNRSCRKAQGIFLNTHFCTFFWYSQIVFKLQNCLLTSKKELHYIHSTYKYIHLYQNSSK